MSIHVGPRVLHLARLGEHVLVRCVREALEVHVTLAVILALAAILDDRARGPVHQGDVDGRE